MRKLQNMLLVSLASLFLLLLPGPSIGQAPDLRSTSHFALFTAAGAFDNLGISSVVGGDIGTHVGTVTGFPPGLISGQVYSGNAFTAQAALDIELVYTDLVTLTCGPVLGTTMGNNQVLTPNIYCLGAATTINGILTLDGLGNPNSVFVFKIDGALATGTFTTVSLINGASPCNVFWQVNGQFTLAGNSVFQGTIINNGAIIMHTTSSIIGRGMSRAGAISLTAMSANLPGTCTASACAPLVLASPANDTVCAGSSASYSVSASGTGLSYQWRKGTVNLVNGGTVSGATSATLTISSVNVADAANTYNVIVTGSCLPADTSANAVLFVKTAPVIGTHPANQTVCDGSPASFSVTATGTGLSYQWRRGTVNLSNAGSVSGALSATLTLNPVSTGDAASDYNVVVSGFCTPPATSGNAALSVNALPVITVGPGNQTACAGSAVSFSTTATGTGLVYQWRKGTANITNGGSISGATTNTLTINPVNATDAAINYNVLISGTCTPAIASTHVSLVVHTAPAIVTGPVTQTACAGSAASFSVTATGSGLSYVWRKGTVVLTNGVGVFGATTATITLNAVTAAQAGTTYNVTVSGSCSPDAVSANAALIVPAATVIINAPINLTACAGNTGSFSVVTTGPVTAYQWRKGTVNITNGGTISGATSATLIINPVNVGDAATNYNVEITGTCTAAFASANAALVVNTAPVITSAPVAQTVCEGAAASFSVTATGTALSYQWRKGTVDMTNGSTVTGATTATLTINPATATDAAANYNVVVSGTCAPAVTSPNVALTVTAQTIITAGPANLTVCAGSVGSFSVITTGPVTAYQWRKGLVNITNGGTISGATSATLVINPVNVADAATTYNVEITGTCTAAFASANAALVVNTAPVITSAPAAQTVCEGAAASFSVTATGTGLVYQWRKGSVNMANNATVTGTTTAMLTISPATFFDAATNYNVIVSGTCAPNDTSAGVALVVNSAPLIAVGPVSQTVCAGSSVTFSVMAAGTGIVYQWRKGTVNITNGGTVSGATSAALTINPVNVADAATTYHVLVSGTCTPALASANASLAVNTAPTLTADPASQTACEGSTVSFASTATGTGLSYQWYKGGVALANTSTTTGATTNTLTLSAITTANAAPDYAVVVSGTCAPADTSVNAALFVDTAPQINALSASQTTCAGGSASFSVTASGTGTSYQWRKGLVNITNGGTIAGATSATLTINPVSVADAATDYNVVVSGTCAPAQASIDISLTVNTAPVIDLTSGPASQAVCAGSPASFSVIASGTGLSYQWRNGLVNIANGGTISGATTPTLVISAVAPSDAATNYHVIVSGTCAPPAVSANATLVVNTAPLITGGPTNQTVCLGSDAIFEVTASGTGLSYQWRKGTVNMTDGGTINGATTSTLMLSPVSAADAAATYNVTVNGTCAPGDTSVSASLTVYAPSAIVTQPNNQMGTNGAPVNFTVLATGSELTYQWRKGTANLLNGGHISGANTATLTIDPTSFSDTASNYNVVVSAACSPDRLSQNAILWVCINSVDPLAQAQAIVLYPNPFSANLTLLIQEDAAMEQGEVRIYNLMGAEVLRTAITKVATSLETSALPAGVYSYTVLYDGAVIQHGKLVAQQ